jgi:hypothetical protein
MRREYGVYAGSGKLGSVIKTGVRQESRAHDQLSEPRGHGDP